jgi:BirA family biotin operon repressor/biotin-[acetyl-CoA-carboxylase] ligase
MPISVFNKETIAPLLRGKRIGHTVHFLEITDSTNDVAFALAKSGAAEGTVVIADAQTKGKGRLNRIWQSPPTCNIYTSIVLRPHIAPVFACRMTLMAGVAVAEFLSRYCAQVMLKWPNDVKINDKKICGILSEMSASAGKIDFVIVGIGINVNMGKGDFDPAFRDVSTSLKEETGNDISRLDLIVELYDHMEAFYKMLLENGFEPIRERWLKYANNIGKYVSVTLKDEIQNGRVRGIDEYGALLIEEDHNIKRITAGDVFPGKST